MSFNLQPYDLAIKQQLDVWIVENEEMSTKDICSKSFTGKWEYYEKTYLYYKIVYNK